MKNSTPVSHSSAFFAQQRSQKNTEPTVKFAKAKRDKDAGMFKDHMATQMPRLHLPHPKL